MEGILEVSIDEIWAKKAGGDGHLDIMADNMEIDHPKSDSTLDEWPDDYAVQSFGQVKVELVSTIDIKEKVITDPSDSQPKSEQPKLQVDGKCTSEKKKYETTEPKQNRPQKFRDELDWADQCIRICKICGFDSIKKSKIFDAHLHHIHKITAMGYKAVHGSNIDRKIYTNCKICNVEVLHTKEELSLHFNRKHLLTLKNYFLKYIKDSKVLEKQDDTSRKEQATQFTVKALLKRDDSPKELAGSFKEPANNLANE